MNRINVPNSAKVFYVTGLIFIIQLIYSWYYDGIFSILFLTLTGLTLIVMYLRFLFKDLLEKYFKELPLHIVPFIHASIMVVIIAGLFAFQYKRENAQSILRASYGEELSNFTIELKENGNYIIINSGIFDTKYSYGKFISKDSIITLDKSSDLLYLKTNKFVVREKMLLPISSDGIVTYNGLFIDYDYRN